MSSAMRLDLAGLAKRVHGTRLEGFAASLPERLDGALAASRHGDLGRWLDTLDSLPEIAVSSLELDAAVVRAGEPDDIDEAVRRRLESALRALCPWRKGPFRICGVGIDTEWRSDLKWARLEHAIAPLAGRRVLDVGCGSGYHCWRMAGAGADMVIGLEPMPLYVVQFLAMHRYLGEQGVWVLPLRLEQLPPGLGGFDTTFSMGVLYHRRSPMDHLRELKGTLARGGQLVLETLVVEGDERSVLVPRDRYARMGNVWFIPSVAMLRIWLERSGFVDAELVDMGVTGPEEQGATGWMPFESLEAGLDADDRTLTVEGYPAPCRAILTATRP